MSSNSITNMSAREMVEHLQENEKCQILVNPYHSNKIGFDLYFAPEVFTLSSISNIEELVDWAKAHRYKIYLVYDEFKKSICAKINRLFPEDTYQEDEKIR